LQRQKIFLVFLLLFLFYRRATCPVVWIELAEWCDGLYRNKVTLPRPSLLIRQNPSTLHQFTDKSASWLMVNPPKLKGLNRVVGKSGVVYTETK
jgi:hypothetical protein